MSEKMIRGFIGFSSEALRAYRKEARFAMTEADLAFVQKHFSEELRDPTEAELRIIDAYWSEEVRHGSVRTRIAKMDIHKTSNPAIQKAFEAYLALFNLHHKGRPDRFPTLMDLSAIASYELSLRGKTARMQGGGICIEADPPDQSDHWLVFGQVVPSGLLSERTFEYQCVRGVFSVFTKGKELRTETECSVGAIPQAAFRAAPPLAGDAILLLGGEQTDLRKLLLRSDFLKLLKSKGFVCEGGLAVAVGRLTDGADMMLDAAATHTNMEAAAVSELALSAALGGTIVIVPKKTVKKAIGFASDEGVNASEIGTVTDKGRLRMYRNNNLIADLPHAFLIANNMPEGAPATLKEKLSDYFIRIPKSTVAYIKKGGVDAAAAALEASASAYHTASVEKLPFIGGNSGTATACACGFDPALSEESPFLGGLYAVMDACCRAVCAGVTLSSMQLLLQCCFAPPQQNPESYGRAISGLLGAFSAQLGLSVGAIGMREKICVSESPRVTAFAFGVSKKGGRIPDQFSRAGQKVFRYRLPKDVYGVPDYDEVREFLNLLGGEALRGLVDFASVGGQAGAAAAVIAGCKGTDFSFRFAGAGRELFTAANGDILFSTERPGDYIGYRLEYIGEVTGGGESDCCNGSV